MYLIIKILELLWRAQQRSQFLKPSRAPKSTRRRLPVYSVKWMGRLSLLSSLSWPKRNSFGSILCKWTLNILCSKISTNLYLFDAHFELSNLDIICLRKVHYSSVQECSSWFLSSRFGVVCSPGSVRSSGCAILFRPSLSLLGSWYDTEGHYLQCEFSFRDQGTHC